MDKAINVNGVWLDVGDIGFTVTFAIADVQDPTARKAFRSSTITVPATDKNLRAFGNPDIVGVLQSTGFTGQLKIGMFTFLGDVILYGFEWIGRERFLSFQLVTNSLVEKLKGVKLSDLDLSSGDHTITAANINSSPTTYVKWGLFDHGNEIKRSETNCFAVERHPGLHVESLVNAIITEAGYSLTGALNTEHYMFDFTKLLINKSNFEDDKIVAASVINFSKIFSAAIANATLTISDFDELIPFVATSDKGNNFNLSKYIVPAAGAYRFLVDFLMDFEVISGGTINRNFNINLKIKVNGTTIATTSHTVGAVTIGVDIPLALDSSFIHLAAGDQVTVTLGTSAATGSFTITPPSGETAFFTIGGDGDFDSEADPRRGLNYPLTIAEILPDVECLEFLKWYFALMNLVFRVDENTKIVTIQDYSGFYTGDIMDWTSKLVIDDQITVEKLKRPAKLTIGYANDDADIGTKNLTGFATVDEVFTEYEDTDGEIIVPFAWTLAGTAYRYGLPGWLVPTAVGDKALNFKTRILKWSPISANWRFEGVTVGTFPYFSGYNLSPSNIKDRYIAYITNLRNSKTVRATFRLTDFDIYNILNWNIGSDARALVRLTTSTLEGLYYLIEVSKWNADTQEAECLLLQASYIPA